MLSCCRCKMLPAFEVNRSVGCGLRWFSLVTSPACIAGSEPYRKSWHTMLVLERGGGERGTEKRVSSPQFCTTVLVGWMSVHPIPANWDTKFVRPPRFLCVLSCLPEATHLRGLTDIRPCGLCRARVCTNTQGRPTWSTPIQTGFWAFTGRDDPVAVGGAGCRPIGGRS